MSTGDTARGRCPGQGDGSRHRRSREAWPRPPKESSHMGLWRITLVAAEREALKGGAVRIPGKLTLVAVGRSTGTGDETPQRVLLVEGSRADAEVVRDAFTAVDGVVGGIEPAPDGQYRTADGGRVE